MVEVPNYMIVGTRNRSRMDYEMSLREWNRVRPDPTVSLLRSTFLINFLIWGEIKKFLGNFSIFKLLTSCDCLNVSLLETSLIRSNKLRYRKNQVKILMTIMTSKIKLALGKSRNKNPDSDGKKDLIGRITKA